MNISDNTNQSTILIIDDEIGIRVGFSDFLEDKGHRVLTAENGRIGLDLFQSEQPDLVLVDLRMPEIEGLEVLSRIKATSKDTPVIVISGKGKMLDAVEALRRGASDYLLKPIEDFEILFHAVESALEKLRLKQENIRYQQNLEQQVSIRTQELKQSNHHLARINERLREIVETTRALSFCTEVGQFGSLLLEKFGLQMQATGGSLYLREKDGLRLLNALDPGHAQGFISFPLREDSIFNQMITQKQPILISDIDENSELSSSGWKGYKDESALLFPLPDESGEIIGILTLHGKKLPPFVEQDKEIGAILASYSCEAMRAVRATQELSLSEERFRELAEMLPVAVFESDLNLSITYANQRAHELFGYSPQEFKQGINSLDLVAPEDRERVVEDTKGPLQGALSTVVEYNGMRKDGSTFPVIYHSNPILKAERKSGFRAIVVDITERKLAEKKLAKVQSFVSSIIDSMPSLIIGVDLNGIVTLWNRTAEKETGIAAEAAKGKPVSHVFPQIASEMNKIKDSIRTQVIKTETNKPRRTELGIRYENITIYPLIAGGEEGAVIRLEDVSEEYETQEQLNQSRKMEAISQLAGGVAHDFNNMLGGIMGAAQLLKSKKRNLDEKSLKFVDMIIQASTRAAEITTKLLAVGRRGTISTSSVDAHRIINDAKSILRQKVDETVSVVIENGAEDCIIVGDSSALLDALMNILINAVYAMQDEGEITIVTKNILLEKTYCKASPFEVEPGPFLMVEIRDTGCGIPLENRSKIFEPFFTTKKQSKGAGLGLAAVYGTIQDHYGVITVSSEVGTGSVFHVFLPLADSSLTQKSDESEVVRGSGRILLADDEGLILTVAKTLMEDMGYEVLLAKNGQEVIEIFQKQHEQIDLIMLDMIMPVMNGSETFSKLREIDQHCKVVISSAFFKLEDMEKLNAEGLSGFIRKPYQQSELSRLLAEVMKK